MQRGPQQRDHRQRDPGLLGAQQQEGVRRVAEGEHGDDEQVPPQRAAAAAPPGPSAPVRAGISRRASRTPKTRTSTLASAGTAARAKTSRRSCRHSRRPDAISGPATAPDVVHRAMEPVGAPEVLGGRDLGQQRVPRRAAHPLADPVGGPDGEDVPRRGRQPRPADAPATTGCSRRRSAACAAAGGRRCAPRRARVRLATDSAIPSTRPTNAGPRLERARPGTTAAADRSSRCSCR